MVLSNKVIMIKWNYICTILSTVFCNSQHLKNMNMRTYTDLQMYNDVGRLAINCVVYFVWGLAQYFQWQVIENFILWEELMCHALSILFHFL